MGNIVTDMLRGNSMGGNQQNGTAIGNIINMFTSIASSKNPDEAFTNVANQNTQVKEMVDMINTQYNGDGKAAFYAKAKEMGINPEGILKLLGK